MKISLTLQESSVLVHLLHAELVSLLRSIAVQFIKPSVMTETSNVWQVDFLDASNYLSLDKIIVGQDTFYLLKKMNDSKQALLYRVSIYIRFYNAKYFSVDQVFTMH